MNPLSRSELIDALAQLVGSAQVLTEARDLAPYFTDWRKQYSANAECVVRPANTGEVSRVVELCANQDIGIVPQGGNTGLCGGSVPTGMRREVVVSLSRLNRIREVDPLNNTITVEAGCVLAAVQTAAEGAMRFFPLSLAAEGSCQIGGNLSTNAGGVNVLRFGNTREQALGLEVVLPDGRVWNGLRGLRKDNTGYDLKQLFIGAEGSLGIITAAVLKLYPKPEASATAWIALNSPREAVGLLASLRGQLGDRLVAFELVSRRCLEAVLVHARGSSDPLGDVHPWYVLAEFADCGSADALRANLERVLVGCAESAALRDAALAHSAAQARALWRIRESIPEAQFSNVKHDISVPVSRLPEFIERSDAALERRFPGVTPYTFGHIGDGNLHYNVGMPDAAATAALIARRSEVNAVVYEVVDALGGSISAEHGLGQLKREEILAHKSALELEMMRAIKRALDPRQVMNPGKVL
ncbi:MAG: FAD-binding oxidoreductase [Betaproteobacteria bacterium]|nr:FAD-binding oxidoreductase [Betaproteobacteria bacterium]